MAIGVMAVYARNTPKRLYWSAPLCVQDCAVTLYGAFLKARYEGHAHRLWLEELERSQWLDPCAARRLQTRWLRWFLCLARDESPYWRNVLAHAGLDAPEQVVLNDLVRLPLLDKETVIREQAQLQSARVASEGLRRQVVWVQTSGTTGKALRLAVTTNAMAREYAFRDLHRSWGGIARGDRAAILMSFPIVPVRQTEPPYWRRNRAQNQLILSSPHISTQTMPAYLDALAEFSPEMIQGFPSGIYLLALGCLDRDDSRIRPRAVYTGSESLLPRQRSVIEAAFGCNVFDWYGTTELAGNIVECEMGRRHVKPDHSIVEFLTEDGRPAAPGETAEIVCTAFGNPATPLIRYRTGDLAVVGAGECECGRPGQLVDAIVGRTNDFIITPDGRHVRVSSDAFRHLPSIVEAQMVQSEPSSMTVRYVPRASFQRDDLRFIEQTIRSYTGNDIRMRFEAVDRVPRGPGGKYRYIVSKVPIDLGSTPVEQS